jgi:hypothetical protein
MVTIGKVNNFWKPKICNATTWAFFAINNASITLSKVSSSHPKLEQLRCVFCYLVVVAYVGLKKGGIISYKSTNKILTLQKHLETNHPKIWIEWIEWDKAIGLGDRRLTKKGLTLPI